MSSQYCSVRWCIVYVDTHETPEHLMPAHWTESWSKTSFWSCSKQIGYWPCASITQATPRTKQTQSDFHWLLPHTSIWSSPRRYIARQGTDWKTSLPIQSLSWTPQITSSSPAHSITCSLIAPHPPRISLKRVRWNRLLPPSNHQHQTQPWDSSHTYTHPHFSSRSYTRLRSPRCSPCLPGHTCTRQPHVSSMSSGRRWRCSLWRRDCSCIGAGKH